MKAKTTTLTNVDIVVFALSRLGGASRVVFSEDIASEAFTLASERFAWQLPQYRECRWPDKYIVKTALEDAKKGEYGALVEGSYANDTSKDGWRLTAQGARWLVERGEFISQQLDLPGQDVPSLARRERNRFLKRIRSNELYQLYGSGNLSSASHYQFTDMLSCSPDAPKEIVTAKFQRLSSMAELSKDSSIIDFLTACGDQFCVASTGSLNRKRD